MAADSSLSSANTFGTASVVVDASRAATATVGSGAFGQFGRELLEVVCPAGTSARSRPWLRTAEP